MNIKKKNRISPLSLRCCSIDQKACGKQLKRRANTKTRLIPWIVEALSGIHDVLQVRERQFKTDLKKKMVKSKTYKLKTK